MPISILPYDGMCEMRLNVDIHGTVRDVTVLVDTGFTTGTGFGLKLPASYAEYARFTGTGHVALADGITVAADSIPDAKIIQVEGHMLEEEVTIPTLFMDGPRCIGVWFLQQCKLELDGPNREAKLEF